VDLVTSLSSSVEQGFWKPQGYAGKGMEGRGQGMECLTPRKPLPACEGRGTVADSQSQLIW